MGHDRATSRGELLLQWAMGAALTLWAAYVLHGTIDGQGVVGWVTEIALHQFGSASTDLCLIAALAIGAVPIAAVFGLLAHALGVTLVRRTGTPSGTPQQIRRRAVLGGIGILVAAGVLVYVVLPRNDRAPPVLFDLDAVASAAPPDAPRVAVVGKARPELAAGYRETSSSRSASTSFRFIPLTDKAWAPGTPVRFFLAEVQRSDEAQGRGIIAVPGRDGRTRYEGRLRRNALATIARGALERAGVRFAEPYWVIGNDTIESMGLVMMIGGLGFALGLAVMLSGARAARQAAARPARSTPPAHPRPPGAGTVPRRAA